MMKMMIAKFFIIWFISLPTFGFVNLKTKIDLGWMPHLIRYITQDSKTSQVLIITENERIRNLNQSFRIDTIIKAIKESVPTFVISSSSQKTDPNVRSFPSSIAPRLCIWITDSSSPFYPSRLSAPVNFLTRLTGSQPRPKFLILSLQNKSYIYEKLLRKLWSEKFLDATVLELIEDSSPNNLKCPMIHSFNPFSQTYSKDLYHSERNLFPDKLRDLHGHALNVSLRSAGTFVKVRWSKTGQLIQFSGPDANIFKSLSKAMNFCFSSSKGFRTGKFDCTEHDLEVFLQEMFKDDLQIFVGTAVHFRICSLSRLQFSRSHGVRSYKAVVPKIHTSTITIQASWKLFYTCLATISLMIIITLVTVILKFDERFWQPNYLIRILLGMTTPEVPEKLIERIVFGSMLLTCSIYSIYVYTMFDDVGLQIGSDIKIDTVDDLITLRLVPVMSHSLMQSTSESGGFFNITKKIAIERRGTHEECLNKLIESKNITCLMTTQSVPPLIKGKSNVGVLKKPLWSVGRSLAVQPSSPYLRRIDEILLVFIESGLLSKWNSVNRAVENPTDYFLKMGSQESSKLQTQLILIMVFGYFFGISAFLVELVVYYWQHGKLGRRERGL